MARRSRAHLNAASRYREKHPEKVRYAQYKSSAKQFILHYGSDEDIAMLKSLIQDRECHGTK